MEDPCQMTKETGSKRGPNKTFKDTTLVSYYYQE